MVEAQAATVQTASAAIGGMAGGIPGGIGGFGGGGRFARTDGTHLGNAMALPLNDRNVAMIGQRGGRPQGKFGIPCSARALVFSRRRSTSILKSSPTATAARASRFRWPIPSPPGAWRCLLPRPTARWAAARPASKSFRISSSISTCRVTLTQGDRVSIPVAAYNYSGARGDVSLQLQQDDWFSLVEDAPPKDCRGRVRRAWAVPQFTLEAKRIGKFKLTLSAAWMANRPRGHRGARNRSDPQRTRAESGLQRPPGKQRQARS